jgi:hypothetical protein
MGREDRNHLILSDDVQVIPRLAPQMLKEVEGIRIGRTSMLRLYPQGNRMTGEPMTIIVSTGDLEGRIKQTSMCGNLEPIIWMLA